MWDSFSNLGTVVSPRQEHVTKDLPYLKEMIPRGGMQKTDIPGLVAGIVIVITTIVIMVITIKV